jgi:hypothetical protein
MENELLNNWINNNTEVVSDGIYLYKKENLTIEQLEEIFKVTK